MLISKNPEVNQEIQVIHVNGSTWFLDVIKTGRDHEILYEGNEILQISKNFR